MDRTCIQSIALSLLTAFYPLETRIHSLCLQSTSGCSSREAEDLLQIQVCGARQLPDMDKWIKRDGWRPWIIRVNSDNVYLYHVFTYCFVFLYVSSMLYIKKSYHDIPISHFNQPLTFINRMYDSIYVYWYHCVHNEKAIVISSMCLTPTIK